MFSENIQPNCKAYRPRQGQPKMWTLSEDTLLLGKDIVILLKTVTNVFFLNLHGSCILNLPFTFVNTSSLIVWFCSSGILPTCLGSGK